MREKEIQISLSLYILNKINIMYKNMYIKKIIKYKIEMIFFFR